MLEVKSGLSLFALEKRGGMYSQKLKEFMRNHRPEPVYLSAEEVSVLADKAGLSAYLAGDEDSPIKPIGPGDVVVVKWEEPTFSYPDRLYQYLYIRNAHIVWQTILTNGKLTFVPYLQFESLASSNREPSELVNLFLQKALTLQPVVYELKNLRTLRRPPWCWGAPVYQCFEEEAEEMAMEYIMQLANDFDFNVKLDRR